MAQGYYSNNNSVAEIYKSVINDVINQVKEAFLDENVDVDVLAQLKKEWEDKVNTSGCVELEPRPVMHQQHHMPPPPMRQGPSGMSAPRQMHVHVARMPAQQVQQVQQIIHHQGHPVAVHMDQGQPRQIPVQHVQYMQQGIPIQQGQIHTVQIGGQQVQAINVGQNVPQGFPQNVRVVQMPANQHQFVQNTPQGMMMVNAQGQPLQQIPFQLPPNVTMQQIRVQQHHHPQQMQQQQHHQLDGNAGGETVDGDPDVPTSSKSITGAADDQQPSLAEAKMVLSQILAGIQGFNIDGGGGGMSDSSSEDEEDEHDPLRSIADKIGNGTTEEGENVVEEDPLNSDDDDADDEDVDAIFDADHIIMCLFEKVNRARNRWKFVLKDGVMNINNRDYCFQKCTGDAEW